jgi:hypothetical protein
MNNSKGTLLLAAAALMSVAGCDCRTNPVVPIDICGDVNGVQADHINSCAESSECADHYSCTEPRDKPAGVKCCIQADRKCVTEADCCPGQTCPADRKKCFDKYLPCETDAECGDKGDMFCEVYTDFYGSSNRCRFKTCSATGQCPSGQSCFQGECMVDLPCGGACEAGKACVASINRCQDYAAPTDRNEAACPMSCAPGFIATFNDSRNIWDSCNLPVVKCVCAELPGLQSGDLGRHSAMASIPGQAIYVSAYDGQYGDLVLYRFDAQGNQQALEYVDGVPTMTPKYGPSGARNGVIEPGEDVGRYTDIAVAGDKIFVSYYDVTNGDLKLAWKQGAAGTWTRVRVDGATANLGLYSSLAIDQDGYPGIAYFQKGGEASFDATSCPAPAPNGPKAFITALKFARARSATPAAPGDFTVTTIACQSRPTPACFGCTTVCADPGTGPACLTAATGCTGCDPNTETCVSVGAVPTCAEKYNPSTLNDIPQGVGLFSALAFNNKDAFIAYMRRTAPTAPAGPPDGDLYGVRVGAQGTVTAPVLLDASGDTGFFPDVKIEPGTRSVAVSYHDFTSRALKYYYAANFQVGVTPEVVDTGLGAPTSGEWNWVGSDSAVVFGSPGQTFAVYQDPTRGDLKWAQRTTGWSVKGTLETNGAVGFFADGLLEGGNLFSSHAKIHARLVAGEPRVDNSLLLSKTPAP